MKTFLFPVYLLVSFAAFTQSSTLIVPNGNNGIFSKNNQPVMSNPGAISPSASGAGTRLMWIPNKSAFRVGTVDGNHWNADSIGTWSTAFGFSTVALGEGSTAMGNSTAARGNYSTTLGIGSIAYGEASTAMGHSTIANGEYATALGILTNAAGHSSTAMGYATFAGGGATAMGNGTAATGSFSTAMGYATFAGGEGSTALGFFTNAGGTASTAMGYNTTASGNYSTAMGYFTTAQAYNSLVMGQYNLVEGTTDSWVTTDPLFVIGNGNDEIVRSNAVTVLKDGKVGIGTSAPDAPLHVTGTGISTRPLQRAYFNTSTGTAIATNTAITANIKVHADGWFWAEGGGFVATSDARIKNIIGRTNNAEDLEKLRKIAVTDYKYIDEVSNGNMLQKKVIAQQVKEIFPVAVNQNKGIIPNVYQAAQKVSIVGNTTHIVTSKAHDFVTGDVVKMIVENESEKNLEVTVIDPHTFSVAQTLNQNVFVYGKQVNDLHNVDYDAIAMLNVSATQELAKQVEELTRKNKELEVKVAELEEIKVQMASLRNLILKADNERQTLGVSENRK